MNGVECAYTNLHLCVLRTQSKTGSTISPKITVLPITDTETNSHFEPKTQKPQPLI